MRVIIKILIVIQLVVGYGANAQDPQKLLRELVEQKKWVALTGVLQARLALDALTPEEHLRHLLLWALAEAHQGQMEKAYKKVEEAQRFLDYSFRARQLRTAPFFQSSIDLVVWDLKKMEGR